MRADGFDGAERGITTDDAASDSLLSSDVGAF
jgi:hypothetical protein